MNKRNPSQDPSKSSGNRVRGGRKALIAGAALLAACSPSGGESREAKVSSTPTPSTIAIEGTTVETAPQPGSIAYEQARVVAEYEEQLGRLESLISGNLGRTNNLIDRLIDITPEQGNYINGDIFTSVDRDSEGNVGRVYADYTVYDPASREELVGVGATFSATMSYKDGERSLDSIRFSRDHGSGSAIYFIKSSDESYGIIFDIAQSPDGSVPPKVVSDYDFDPRNAVVEFSEGNMGGVDSQLASFRATIDRFEPFPDQILDTLEEKIR